ncbi:hypothetical protein [Jiulongibacter sp. NS-SX5]|uniref:hypothetical protein n=1 Tax=Jiulongibacter sp. NS-SX5 TaxID=3463854 RepID=UPI004057FD0E
MNKRAGNIFQKKPESLLQLDAAGAFLSAILLGIVLPIFSKDIGFEVATLQILAIAPMIFLLFDLYSLSSNKISSGSALKIIGILNLVYCVFSVYMMTIHASDLRPLGWVYFITEVLIVAALGLYEITAAVSLNKS